MNDLTSALKESLAEGHRKIVIIRDPVTGFETTERDLREREQAAREVAESLPPRRLKIVKRAYEQMLSELLWLLADADCVVRVKTLPAEIRTGKQTVAELEQELTEYFKDMVDCFSAKLEERESD